MEKRSRQVQINFRVSEAEKQELAQKAANAHFGVSRYLRSILGFEVAKSKPERNGGVSSVALKLLFVVSTLGPGIYLWVERSGYIHACLSFVC